MRLLLALLLIATHCVLAGDILQITNKNVLLTNWIQPTADWRMVDGKIYQTSRSKAWKTIAEHEHLGGEIVDLHGNTIRLYMSVRQVMRHAVVLDIYRESSYPEMYSGMLEVNGKTYSQSVVALNYPKTESLLVGSGLTGLCMRTTNILSLDGRPLAGYDYGTPVTNLVPTYQWIKIKVTNAVKQLK